MNQLISKIFTFINADILSVYDASTDFMHCLLHNTSLRISAYLKGSIMFFRVVFVKVRTTGISRIFKALECFTPVALKPKNCSDMML